jgi:hypothetical protein
LVVLVLLQSPSPSRPAVVDDSWFEEVEGLQQNQRHQRVFFLFTFSLQKIQEKRISLLTFSLQSFHASSSSTP